MSGTASRTVADGLAQLRQAVDDDLGGRLDRIVARADDPPTIAVAGRVSAGKSTLVNALVGRRVAPTDAGECTQVVARFRYGRDERVVVHRHDGSEVRVPFDDQGRIPSSLGVPVQTVDHLEVLLSNRRLRDVELVDTPGVSSSSAASGRSEAFLAFDAASRDEVARADAVVYLLTHTGRSDEAADLAAFGAGAGGRSDAAVGVLGKADLVASGDPAAAADLAERLEAQLRGHVHEVIPVWTLVAESVSCGRFGESDAATAAAVAGLDATDRELMLLAESLFVEEEVPVDRYARAHLQDILGHAGAVRVVEMAGSGVLGAARLTAGLDDLSGRSRLDGAISGLARRADALRAARMLTDAEKLGFDDWVRGASIRDQVERLRALPALHVLDETTARGDVLTGRARLSVGLGDEALAILDDPSSVVDLDAAIDRWRSEEALCADPLGGRVARTVTRTLSLRRQGLR